MPAHSRGRSRRVFLARLGAGWFAGLAALGGCRRADEPEPVDASGADGPDEAVAAASRRPALPRTEPVVRVRILRVRDRAKPVRLGAEGRWVECRVIGEDSAPDGTAEPALVLHGPVEARLGTRGWSVVDGRGFRAPVPGRAPIEFRAAADGGLDRVAVQGRPYPGAIRLVPLGSDVDAGLDVVNHVGVERYLPGVLERELYRTWHPTTYAAQAVAARSFACAERAYRGGRHYDLTSTERSQVYGGASSRARAIEAVDRTRGLVLAYAGRLVPGYYSSCCGGLAAAAVDAISDHPTNDVPPLRGRSGHDVCTGAARFSWTRDRQAEDVTLRLATWGRARGVKTLAARTGLRAIDVSELNPHGRPRTYVVTTGDGATTPLAAETMRRAVDHAVPGRPAPSRRLWSANVRVTVTGDAVRFDGFGHGHGAGLCQHGAEVLAQAREPYESIIAWYYPSADITPAY